MLSKEVFKENMDKLLKSYVNWKFDRSDSEMVSIWYEKFKYKNDKEFSEMVDAYILEEKFNPTIAGILEYNKRIPSEAEKIKNELASKRNELIGKLELGEDYHAMNGTPFNREELERELADIEQQLRDSQRQIKVN